jgi:hypothetical protein
MLGSSTPSPPRAVEVTSSRRPDPVAHEKNVGLISRSTARPVREDQRATRSNTTPGGLGASEARRNLPCRVDPPNRSEERALPSRHLFNSSNRPDTDSLQRHPSRARSTSSASMPSAPQEADSGAAPRCLQSLIIRGGRAPDVQVSLAAGGGQGSASATAEVGRIAPEQLGERSAAVEAAGRSGAAPRVGWHQACSPRAGLVRPSDEEVPGPFQDVSSRLWFHCHESFGLFVLQNRPVFL